MGPAAASELFKELPPLSLRLGGPGGSASQHFAAAF